MQSAFPPVHYFILALLGGSILVSFFLQSDSTSLAFLGALQVSMIHIIISGHTDPRPFGIWI